MLCNKCVPLYPCDDCIKRAKRYREKHQMKHCIDCKYIGMPDKLYTRAGDPELDSICMHPLAKKGEPTMIMKHQTYTTCYEMRKVGGCGLDAKLHVEKPKDKVCDDE